MKFAYAAEREDELTLVKGSRVVVMEKCSDGWWRGSSGGHMGWFPSNYVLEEGDGEEPTPAAPAPGGGAYPSMGGAPAVVVSNGQSGGGCDGRVFHTVQTLYPFSSVTDEELNFDKGEVMEVVEKPDDDPEWWRCRNARGLVGLVPRNYVLVLSDGPLDSAPLGTSPSLCVGPAGSGRFPGRDWYYGGVTRVQAEGALNERGLEGDFLVRDSESSVSSLQSSPGNNRDVCILSHNYCAQLTSPCMHVCFSLPLLSLYCMKYTFITISQ